MKTPAKLLTACLSCMAALTLARGQDHTAMRRHVTLQEAVQLALNHNHIVRIAKLGVEEKKYAKDVARSKYFPTIENDSRIFAVTDTQFIEIPAGAFGVVGGTPIPETPEIINQGGKHFVTSGTGLVQPLTQLFTKVKPANDIARADLAASRANAQDTENQVALKARKLYYGILVAQLRRNANEIRIKAAQQLENERVQQVKYGSALNEELIASTAASLQAKQDLLTTELQLSDLTLQLDDAIGLPLNTELELDLGVPGVEETCQREDCIKSALASHPQIMAAREEVHKASDAVQLSKAEYVPDISVFARYSHQENVPFLAHNFGTFGLQLNYELFDGGRRRAAVRERNAQLAQAKENLARVTEEIELAVRVAYNRLQRTREMVNVSEKLLSFRSESSRVLLQQVQNGSALGSQADTAAAEESEARAQLLQSQLDYVQARDELIQAMGLTP